MNYLQIYMANYINVGHLNNKVINMEKEIKKILPDGKPSGLSLNQFKIYRTSNSKWNGVSGEEIYSIKLFRKKFLNIYPQYELNKDFDVLNFVKENYKNDIKIWNIIEEIVDGLANIIISLYEADKECVKYNSNLFESDWEFWKKCKYIVLDGRIILGSLGDEIVKHLSDKLQENLVNIKILKLSDFTEVDTVSLFGCAHNNYKMQYVFDFGNSAVKRGVAIKNKKNIEIKVLNPIFHEDFWELEDNLETAMYIDKFICNIILETISEINEKTEDIINISLCIANNILNNKIANRGSYRFLRLIADNYKIHLSKKLSEELKKIVNVHIYNDAEAVGRIFTDFSPDTAVITLGTMFGIAYPPRKE